VSLLILSYNALCLIANIPDDPDAEASENDSSDYSSGSDVEPGADAQDAPDEVDEPTGAEGVTVESRIESDFECVCR
jgi:hypothetical protein